jgi:predicted transposase YbfD/YdcC
MAKMNELYRLFAFGNEIPDPRRDHLKKHPLINILTISVCAMLAGADDWTDMGRYGQNYRAWFEQFLDMPHGPPSHDTIRRVFSMLEPDAFSAALSDWLQHLRSCPQPAKLSVVATPGSRQLAVDGKQLKASFDQSGLTQPWLMVSAYATESGIVLGQQGASGQTGELVAIHDLLDRLDLKGRLVSLDALGCQKDIAEKIREKQGDYLMSLKANHPTLEAAARERLADKLRDDPQNARHDRNHAVTLEKSHGRQTLRRCVVLRDVKGLPGIEDWTDACAAVLVATGQDRPLRRQKPTQPAREQTTGMRLFLTSWDASADDYLHAVRSHWLVENQVHWSLDVTFGEDRSRLRKDHGPSNLATLRRVTLSLLKAHPSKDSLKLKRKLAGWDPNKLLEYLGLTQPDQPKHREK